MLGADTQRVVPASFPRRSCVMALLWRCCGVVSESPPISGIVGEGAWVLAGVTRGWLTSRVCAHIPSRLSVPSLQTTRGLAARVEAFRRT